MPDGETPVDAVAQDAGDTPADTPDRGADSPLDGADAEGAAEGELQPDATPDEEGGFSIKRRLEKAFLESDGKHPDSYARDRIANSVNDKLDDLVGDGDAAREARLGERIKIVGDRLLDRDLDEGFPGWLELLVGLTAWVWYVLTGAPDDDAETVDVDGGTVDDTQEGSPA
jgi:hypothetical protein